MTTDLPKALPLEELLALMDSEPKKLARRLLAGERFAILSKPDAEMQVQGKLICGEPRAVVTAWRRVGEGWERVNEDPPISFGELIAQIRDLQASIARS